MAGGGGSCSTMRADSGAAVTRLEPAVAGDLAREC